MPEEMETAHKKNSAAEAQPLDWADDVLASLAINFPDEQEEMETAHVEVQTDLTIPPNHILATLAVKIPNQQEEVETVPKKQVAAAGAAHSSATADAAASAAATPVNFPDQQEEVETVEIQTEDKGENSGGQGVAAKEKSPAIAAIASEEEEDDEKVLLRSVAELVARSGQYPKLFPLAAKSSSAAAATIPRRKRKSATAAKSSSRKGKSAPAWRVVQGTKQKLGGAPLVHPTPPLTPPPVLRPPQGSSSVPPPPKKSKSRKEPSVDPDAAYKVVPFDPERGTTCHECWPRYANNLVLCDACRLNRYRPDAPKDHYWGLLSWG
jgi:hypothetical protein